MIKIKNFACVQFENEFFAFNVLKNKLFHFSGDEILLDKESLTLKKTYHDSMGREKTAKYHFEDDVVLDDEQFSINGNIRPTSKLLGYQIMESVVAKDFGYVYKNLSKTLQEKIDSEKLRAFFGNLSHFVPLGEDSFLGISNNEKKYVAFSISGDKVEDISIDEL